MYFPYFKFGCDLEINAAATAAYVTAQCDICDDEIKGTLVLTNDCDPLLWTTGNPPTPVTYDTPATDPAPWYDAGTPESARFLGYRVLNVTKANPLERSITKLISNMAGVGGVIAPFRPSAQRYNFQILLFACDELAMEYGYRWLDEHLRDGCVGATPCSVYDVEFRNTCQHLDSSPTQLEVMTGRWFLKNAGLVEGPIWGDDPLPGMRKYIRRADFSIVSEQPWTYGTPVGLTFEEAYPPIGTDTCGSPTLDAFFCDRLAISETITTDDTPGTTAFLVEIHADDYTMQDVTIEIFEDACPASGSPIYTLHIDRIPPENTFTLDTSTNTMIMTSVGGSVDGSPFLDLSDGPITFPVLPGDSGDYCVVIEADECSIRPDTWVSVTQVIREF